MLRYQPLNRVRRRVTLLRYKRCCFSNVNYSQIMLARYWSLSRQNHLQLHSKSKAWQLSKQLKNGLLTKHKIKCTCRSYNQRMQFIINPGWWDATKEFFFGFLFFYHLPSGISKITQRIFVCDSHGVNWFRRSQTIVTQKIRSKSVF